MKLRDIYASGRPAVSVEFFPPKTERGELNLASRIPAIRDQGPAFCSMTYGAGGSTREKTLWWAHRLKHEFGIEVMVHLTCVGHSRAQLDATFADLQASAIENIIALRGDPPAETAGWAPHPGGFGHAIELVRAAHAAGDFSVAVAGFPEGHPEAPSLEDDLIHLREKVEAGADVVITQLFLDNDAYHRFVDRARHIGISVPIVPGVLPFRSVAQLRKFTSQHARSIRGPALIPPALEARLGAVEDNDEAALRLGIEYATRQCDDLLRSGAPGIHFYCLNESNAVEAILRNLRLTGFDLPGAG